MSAITVNNPCRQWALDNVRRAERPKPICGHWADGAEIRPGICVACAYELGRREGHVEAGAYYTHAEVTEHVRRELDADDSHEHEDDREEEGAS
jgi:hypothetical protein